MSFPTSLSPSPVHEAFSGIHWDPVEKLELSDPEKALFRSAEENPLEYTLGDQHDAESYAHLLMKVIGLTSNPSASNSLKVSRLKLDQYLPDHDALQLLYTDLNGVVLHYAISKLSEMISCLKNGTQKVSLSSTFYPSGILTEDWRPLLRILSGSKSDPFAQRGAAYCLANILLEGCNLHDQSKLFSPVSSILMTFVSWVTSRLQSSSTSSSLAIVIPSLTVIMVSREARRDFDETGGVGYIARHLQIHADNSKPGSNPSVQQLYELVYCLWLLSFDCQDNEQIRKHFHRDGAVAALVNLVAAAPREKVVRLGLSTLCNLALCTGGAAGSAIPFDGRSFLTEMIGSGLLKTIDRMKEQQKWTDPDMEADLKLLHQHLHETFRHMTRWDVYVSEIESHHLQWGIVHTEKFFRQNVKLMEGKDGKFEIVKVG